jgi:hypothetical protein
MNTNAVVHRDLIVSIGLSKTATIIALVVLGVVLLASAAFLRKRLRQSR